MKRLLLIGDTNSLYVHNYAIQLRAHYGKSLIIDIFTTFPSRREAGTLPYDNIFGQVTSAKMHPQVRRLIRPMELLRFLKNQRNKYDVLHVLYCIQEIMVLTKPLRKVAPRLILTVFGSDFFQLAEWKKRWMRPVFQSADIITSNNSKALKAIGLSFSTDPAGLRVCRFGFNALDTLYKFRNIHPVVSRQKLNLPCDKVIICIGYNYDSIQQHLAILSSIADNRDLLDQKEKLYFLIPMTYGTEPEYRKELLETLSRFPFRYHTLENFLSEEENAHLRKAPDIMVQLQKSDSFSASTQEHMYGGNLVITGQWLPYDDLIDAGIYFRQIATVHMIGEEIVNCLKILDTEKSKCSKNAEAVYRISSWEANLPSWLALYP